MKKALVACLAIAALVSLAYAQAKFAWIAPTSDDKDGILPGIDPAKVMGPIVTAGSSTVFPLSEALAEMFREDGYAGQITIDSIGTGAGFERFCKTGETDIANASRAIKQSERDQAAKLAVPRTPLEFRVGTDALAVVVSRKNSFVKDVTTAELALLFSTATYWSDVRPSWPRKEIKRFSPGTDSGTFDYFVEHVFGKRRELILGARNLQLSEDDNILVRGIGDDPYAIGYFGFAYYVENKAKLSVLSIEGIEANAANVDAMKYPLARPLFLYSDARIMVEKPQVAAFIAYYLSYVGEVVKKVGYFPAPPAAIRQAKQAWANAMKGRY